MGNGGCERRCSVASGLGGEGGESGAFSRGRVVFRVEGQPLAEFLVVLDSQAEAEVVVY
jgi:hypothetical protein